MRTAPPRADVLLVDYADGRIELHAGQYGAVMPDGRRHVLSALDLRRLALRLVVDGHARVAGPGHLVADAPRLDVLERIAQQAHEKEARRALQRP